MLNDIATGPPPWQMYVDKTQPSPVVGDGVPRRLVLAHGEGEQVEAGLDRVLPEDFVLECFRERCCCVPDVIVGADLEGEPALMVGCQVQDHRDH